MSEAPGIDFPMRIGFDQAEAIVRRVAGQRQLGSKRVALPRAHGRVLAQHVSAPLPLPPFDNSAMDGFALRHCDALEAGATLRLVGEQFAGPTLPLQVGEGECIRITTGAPLPPGADTVVMKEDARVAGDRVTLAAATRAGQHVRRAGEDVEAGQQVLQAGQVLTPARIALAASLGLPELEVSRRPSVAVFATGDELVEPGLPLQPGQIYNSNRELLMGLLRDAGLEPGTWPTLPDDPQRLRAMLRDAASSCDVVITCGGVSAGEKDHLPQLLQAEGDVFFWKVRMRPGMPLLFGALGNAVFMGLPGNPVSVLATWLALGRPLVDGLQGATEPRPHLRARLAAPWTKRHERLEFLRGRLRSGDDGILLVEPNPADGSHRMRGAADSDALVILPEGERSFASGEIVTVLLY